jgi:copper homeostasis protein
MKLLEIACDSVTSGINAEAGGADRIELCDNLAQGGTTPSAAKIKLAKKHLSIPVFVLVRPRSGDFLYSSSEFQTMLEDVDLAKQLNADGIVSGVLCKDGSLDLKRTQQLVEVTAPLPFTFHRAFDMCSAPALALEELVNLGVQRILTSGQNPTALEGQSNITKWVAQSNGRIAIVAGSGIRANNIAQLLHITGLNEFHSSAKKLVNSQMQYKGKATMGTSNLKDEFQWFEVDTQEVATMKKKML